LCGNRHKVAAYRKRRRAEGAWRVDVDSGGHVKKEALDQVSRCSRKDDRSTVVRYGGLQDPEEMPVAARP